MDIIQISPKELYPTESLFSINEKKIKYYMGCFDEKISVEDIHVIKIDDEYYIIDGHHKMLAANRLKLLEVQVDVIDDNDKDYSEKRNNIVSNCESIGMTALFDFETVGGFLYKKYPQYYSNNKQFN